MDYVQKLEDVINSTACDIHAAAYYMATSCHRYLQEQFFKIALGFMEIKAKHFNQGRYDARNEWTCAMSHTIINLLEKNGQYYPFDYSFYEKKYPYGYEEDKYQDKERVNIALQTLLRSVTWESETIAEGADEKEINEMLESYFKEHGEEILRNLHQGLEIYAQTYFHNKLK